MEETRSAEKMRICFIGMVNSIHLERWARYFINKGHDVHVISQHKGDIKGAKVHRLPAVKKIGFIPSAIQTRRMINKIKPDIVHAHYVTTYGFYGAFSGFHPFIASAWGSDVLTFPKSRISKGMVRFVLNKADLITCDGENSKDAMINLGEDSQKIKIVYHGVDTKEFSPEQKDKELIKKLFGEEKFPAVISARSLRPMYDIGTLIKAMPSILKKISDAKFIIAGEGSEQNYFKELAKSLGILNSIRFVGYIPHNELPKYLASSDVYVSTSLWDGGIAVATLDAMACELAPVVTDVADNRKWIKDGENGFIVPIKKPKLLAEKVIYLLENKKIRKKFGEISRNIVKEKQEYEKEMKKMETLYKKLTGMQV